MRNLICIALMLAIVCPLAAQEELTDPSALSGLRTVHLAVGDITLAGGASADGLLQRIRANLLAAGFTLSGEEGTPTLALELHMLQNATDGLVVGHMTLALSQSCTVVRTEGATPIPALAKTWDSTSLIMAASGAATLQVLIEATVDNLTSQFIQAHREVNGRLSTATSTRRSWWISRLWPFS